MSSKKNIFIIAISIIVAGLAIGGAILYSNQIKSKKLEADLNKTLPLPPDETKISERITNINLDYEGYPFIGEKDAPVTIIEINDYQCPFCKTFASEVMPELKEKYIDTNKVKFVFRDFPLPYHPYSQKSAEAALCYYDQELNYYDYYTKLFENTNALETENLIKYAEELGADNEQFSSCLENGDFEQTVKTDFEEINRIIQSSKLENFGTPAFLINGKPLIGAQSLSAFDDIIEGELQEDNNSK
ncbi:DsbA family protein [bacterium]|nr:MAG: DsbA family protein [bacterium]